MDLFEDDGDGIIETILLFDEDKKEPERQKTGCAVLLMSLGTIGGLGLWTFLKYLA